MVAAVYEGSGLGNGRCIFCVLLSSEGVVDDVVGDSVRAAVPLSPCGRAPAELLVRGRLGS